MTSKTHRVTQRSTEIHQVRIFKNQNLCIRGIRENNVVIKSHTSVENFPKVKEKEGGGGELHILCCLSQEVANFKQCGKILQSSCTSVF